MADKQLAYNASRNADVFADDDPLAELARIVGFDQRSSSQAPVADRRDPAFDLEDELLQEFERYDSPRRADIDMPHLEPANDVAALPVVTNVPREPFFEAAAPQPAEENPPLSGDGIDAGIDMEALLQVAPEPAPALSFELADELEMSVAPVADDVPAKAPQWSAASIRLPLANFNMASSRPAAVSAGSARLPVSADAPERAPVVDAPVSVEPAAPAYEPDAPAAESSELGFFAEHDRHEDGLAPLAADHGANDGDQVFDLSDAARDGLVAADVALTQPAYRQEPADVAFDVDNLLADVSRYPVPNRARPSPAMADEAFEALMNEPAFIEKAAPASLAMPAKGDLDAEDPFAGQDFEFDLDGIELELADLDFAASEPAAVAPVEPQPVAASAAEAFVAQAARPAAEPVAHPNVVASENRAPSARVAAEPFEAELNLPFDPSDIADAEEHPEAVEDMHVPALPPVEDVAPVAKQPDFDFDIDAEMAALFDAQPRRNAAAAETQANHVFSWESAAGGASDASRTKSLDEFDEFERALEEDFRRSINEPVRRAENVARMSFEPSSVVADRQRARSMRGMVVAAALIVVFGTGAYAGYRWVFDGSPIGIGGGDPKVIVADKDPVKVVPENPGGKTVPNQDKAVYDQVAGAAAQAPKQKTLISSDEEPVDVVQRTLIPEDGGADDGDGANVAASTPVGDTQDPRLLPSQDGAQPSGNGDDAPSVAPRKVRTMIVKPDGTLVARDEPAPVAPTAAALPASSEVASADLRTGTAADVAAANQPALPAETTAPAAPAASQDTPVEAAKAPKVSDAAPIPMPRPAEQPVNVVGTVTDKGNVKPAAQPVEVASVAPAAPAAASSGGYGMQIASLPSEAEAKKSFASLSSKFSSVLGGRAYEIRKADIAGKGTYYRVRIPAGSKDEAAALCQQYRQAGGTCLISK